MTRLKYRTSIMTPNHDTYYTAYIDNFVQPERYPSEAPNGFSTVHIASRYDHVFMQKKPKKRFTHDYVHWVFSSFGFTFNSHRRMPIHHLLYEATLPSMFRYSILKVIKPTRNYRRKRNR